MSAHDPPDTRSNPPPWPSNKKELAPPDEQPPSSPTKSASPCVFSDEKQIPDPAAVREAYRKWVLDAPPHPAAELFSDGDTQGLWGAVTELLEQHQTLASTCSLLARKVGPLLRRVDELKRALAEHECETCSTQGGRAHT